MQISGLGREDVNIMIGKTDNYPFFIHCHRRYHPFIGRSMGTKDATALAPIVIGKVSLTEMLAE
jgi:hypothetical protein